MAHTVRYVISDKISCTCYIAVVPVMSLQGLCMYIWLLVSDIPSKLPCHTRISHMPLVFKVFNMWTIFFFFPWYVTIKLNIYHSMCHLTFSYCTSGKIVALHSVDLGLGPPLLKFFHA
uniref:Uncharacterized protein n=1 Tax=Rhipicephalus zambeziensis TaxID=60191 RepID=A0A224Y4Y8_9ACAR